MIALEQIEVPAFLIAGWRDLFPEAMSEAYRRIPGSEAAALRARGSTCSPTSPPASPSTGCRSCSASGTAGCAACERRRAQDEPPVLGCSSRATGAGGAKREWPPARAVEQIMYPNPGGVLETHQQEGGGDIYQGTPLVGVHGGQWDAMATGMGYPLDQGPDDLLSLTYTTEPLEDGLELGGSPEAVLHVERLDGDGAVHARREARRRRARRARRADHERLAAGARRGRGADPALGDLVRARTRPPAAPQRELRGLPARLAGPGPSRRSSSTSAPPSCGFRSFPRIPRSRWEEPPRPPEVAPGRALSVDDRRRPGMALGARRGGQTPPRSPLGGGEAMRLPEGGTFSISQRATASVLGRPSRGRRG